jgi:2-keto-4-pentenoate hydratase
MQDSVAPLIREAMTLDNIADALVRHATVHGCAGDQAVACRLRRMGRELRTKAMLKRGHAAAILGHELPTAGVR